MVRASQLFVCVALLASLPSLAAAEGELRVAEQQLQLDDCERALNTLTGYTPRPEEDKQHVMLLVTAHVCAVTDADIEAAVSALKAFAKRTKSAEERKEVKVVAAMLEQTRPAVRAEAATAAADRAALQQAERFGEQNDCSHMKTEALDKVSKSTRYAHRKALMEARYFRCIGGGYGLEQAERTLGELDKQAPHNPVIELELDQTRRAVKELAQKDAEDKAHIASAGTLLEQKRCDDAEAELAKVSPRWRNERIYLLRDALLDRCTGDLENASHKLDRILTGWPGDQEVLALQKEVDAELGEQVAAEFEAYADDPELDDEPSTEAPSSGETLRQAKQAEDGAAHAGAASASKNVPKLLPRSGSMGFSGEYVTYRDGADTSGLAVGFATALNYVDLTVGLMVTGPESTGYDVKAALHLIAWPDPAVSKFSIMGAAGVGLRSWFSEAESMKEGGTVWRSRLTANVRVTCGIVGSISYEPAITDGAPSTVSFGLELQLKYGRGSACEN